MQEADLRELLDDVRSGAVAPDDALRRLRRLPFTDLGFARVDHHRAIRQGMAEAVYAPGKSPAECVAIVSALRADGGAGPIVLTRADDEQAAAALAAQPDGATHPGQPTTIVWDAAPSRAERVAVVTAGTSDGPVARECIAVLAAYGLNARQITDVGVSGLHRLLASVDELIDAEIVVVVAGMEGALPSVVAGLTAAPVVAVPTSVGYGAGFEGVTALLAMLASWASTTDTARPARSSASSGQLPERERDPRLVPLLLGDRRGHGPRRARRRRGRPRRGPQGL